MENSQSNTECSLNRTTVIASPDSHRIEVWYGGIRELQISIVVSDRGFNAEGHVENQSSLNDDEVWMALLDEESPATQSEFYALAERFCMDYANRLKLARKFNIPVRSVHSWLPRSYRLEPSSTSRTEPCDAILIEQSDDTLVGLVTLPVIYDDQYVNWTEEF